MGLFDNFDPNGFRVIGAFIDLNGKPWRYVVSVPVMHPDFDKLTEAEFRAKYGYGDTCRTMEEAKARLKADMEMAKARTDKSGLIDWGKGPPREYRIYKIAAEDVTER